MCEYSSDENLSKLLKNKLSQETVNKVKNLNNLDEIPQDLIVKVQHELSEKNEVFSHTDENTICFLKKYDIVEFFKFIQEL